MKLLVTGGAGFIGSNFIRYSMSHYPDWTITNLDKLTYAGNLENLRGVERNTRYDFVKGDIGDADLVDDILRDKYDVIVNFAAESHVDRSIADSSVFIDTNIGGTHVLLEGARKHSVGLYVQVSTDEVYGSTDNGKFKESSPINPNNPYSASKAGADLLCRAYYQTHKLPVIITRSTNNFGSFQFPEKLIPLSITNLIEGRTIPVYGDGLNIRDWIYVEDHCRAIAMVVEKGRVGEIYNISASNERTNLELIRAMLDIMQEPSDVITFVSDRPGHDRRYSIDSTKIRAELGWEPLFKFEHALEKTIEWYLLNEQWWRRVRAGEYRTYVGESSR